MFLLGLAAIVQIVFLPGFLALRLMRVRLGFFSGLIGCFGLSLLINHFLVWGLVLAGVYRSGVIYGVFAAECLLWLLLVRRSGRVTIAEVLRRLGENVKAGCADFLPRDLNDKPGLLRMAVFLAVIGLLVGYVLYELVPPDRIFSEWDAVVSWNRWACDWAQNRLPLGTAEYPQLLPANLSLTYVFIQNTTVWFFAKAVMFLFCLGTLLAIFDLGMKTGRIGYLLGVLFTFMLFQAILRARNLSSGYADVPAAFFVFSSIYFLLRGSSRHTPCTGGEGPAAADGTGSVPATALVLAAAFAAGAALTKQAGLFLAAVFPLLAYLSLSRRERAGVRADGKEDRLSLEPLPPCSPHPNPLPDHFVVPGEGTFSFRGRELFLATLLMLLLIAPWYLYKQWHIRHGGDFSITAYLVRDIHEGRTAWQRLGHAGSLLHQELSLPGLAFLAITLLGAVRNSVGRRLVFVLVVPFTLLWGFAFSYSTRNLALVLPLAGVAAGIGVLEILDAAEGRLARRGMTLWRWVPNLLSAPAGALLLPLALGLAVLGHRIPPADLLARQEMLQKQIGLRDMNEGLYAYQREHGFTSAITGDYYCLEWLPELNRYYRACSTRDLPAFRAAYESPSVGYALLHKEKIAPAVRNFIEQARGKGEICVVLESRYYRLYKKLGKSKIEDRASKADNRPMKCDARPSTADARH